MKKSLIFTIITLFSISMFSCKNTPAAESETSTSTPMAEEAQPVKITLIEKTTIKRTVHATASMVADEETYLAPGIAGMIRSILVDVDDRVKEGQLLVRMDKSQLSQTRVQYVNLKKDLARMDTLLQYGSITQQAYDQLNTQVNVTKVMLSSLEENTELRAPYNGVVTGKYFNDGELFSPAPNTPAGKAAIISLVKMDVMKLYINISERYLPIVKKGQIAQVETEVYPKENFSAEVFRIFPTINAATRTFTVELHMKNPELKLRPGMYSSVTLELGDREALLVPSLAVIKQSGTNSRYIFLHENGQATKRIVQVGERINDKLEIIPNGIQGGEELIYAGHINLLDGDKVDVVNE